MRRFAAALLLLVSPALADDHWVIDLDNAHGPVATAFALDAPRDQAIVVTACHVLAKSQIPFRINGRQIEPSDLIGYDETADVAAMLIPWVGNTAYFSPHPPTRGMDVNAEGHTSGVLSGSIEQIVGERAYYSFGTDKGDSGGPVVGDTGIVAMITHGFNSRAQADGRSPSYGPTAAAMERCLLRWGWKCERGRCIRIEPPALPAQPTKPITPQVPPATWTPISSKEANANTSQGQAIATNTATIERILERLVAIDARVDSPTSTVDPRIGDNAANVERLTEWVGTLADRPAAPPPDPRIEEYQLRIAALERRIKELEALPITFAIRTPSGIEKREKRLGEELKLYFEGRD